MTQSTSEQVSSMIGRGRHLIPAYMWGAVERYMVNRIPGGSFLTALFSNDLIEAFARADCENGENMRRYAQFLHNYAPRGSYGSPEAVRSWLNLENEND